MKQDEILFSRASVPFKAPEGIGIAEYDRKSVEEYRSIRKEFDPPADDSEKLLAPWKERLARRKDEIVIHAGPQTHGECLSLPDAQKKVRSILADRPDAAITVLLRRGVYPFRRTLAFGREDSGSRKIRFSGSEKRRMRFSFRDPPDSPASTR